MSVIPNRGPRRRGHLIPIGGAEDKIGTRAILSQVLELSGGNRARLLIIPTASSIPVESGNVYCRVFTELGAAAAEVIDVRNRQQANDPGLERLFDGVTGIFFTGGDQMRLLSLLGGTLLAEKIIEAFASGITVSGTSAGASALSEHMIAFGRSGSSPSQRMVQLAPGFGLTDCMTIDQHFRQRDRLGRLMTAVAYNPSLLGIGIDEDTAFVIAPGDDCWVIGSGSVTIIDGSELEHTNIATMTQHHSIAVTGMKVHVLTSGYRYHLGTRQPCPPA
jgi:cyanophycinase